MKKWNSRSIAFVAIFVAIATIMSIIGIKLFPPAILPSLRFSIIGLPIKITGFIFGPWIGALTGALADIVSLQFAPTTYSWQFTAALVLNGLIPGMVFWLYFKFIKNNFSNEAIIARKEAKIIDIKNSIKINWASSIIEAEAKISKLEKDIAKLKAKKYDRKLMDIFWLSSISILASIAILVSFSVWALPDSIFEQGSLIKSKINFSILILFGIFTMIIFITIIRFIKYFRNNNHFFTIVPIIVFSAILEPFVSVLISWGDVQSGALQNFEAALISHFIISPIKIWINLVIIYLTSLIVIPIISKKTVNSY